MSIFYFQNDLNKIVLNIEMPKQDDIYACFNKNCDKMSYKSGVYFYKLNQENPIFYNDKVGNIELVSSKNTLEKFSDIDLFVGHKYYKIKLKNIKTGEIDFLGKKAHSFNLPIKSNEKTAIQKLGVYFESLFYNWYFYLISYIFILVYFIKYQQRFEFKIKHSIFLILFLATFLRFSHIDFVPLWNDELYTLTYISDMGSALNFSRTFLDPGNPPLFFILSNIWLYFFSENIFQIRLLPIILGVAQVYLLYLFARKILSEKIAIIASFLSAINIFIIVESNEIRSYILAMMLVILGCYSFYKLKNEFNIKNLIFYVLISILLINTHYYCILYVLANFALGMFLFKDKIRFLGANVLSFLSFVPYFLITFKQKSLMDNFNTWIEKPTWEVIYNHIIFYFGNAFWLILIILFSIFVFKKIPQKEAKVFLYNVYVISFVFVGAFLISMFIKPILFERYLCIFLPLFILNTAIFLSMDFKSRFQPLIVVAIFLVSINAPKYENFNLFSNLDMVAQFYESNYMEQKMPNYLVISDRIDYAKYFSSIPKERIIVSNYGIREDVDLFKEFKALIPDKKAILFVPEICVNSKMAQDINTTKINTTIVPIYKVVLK